VTIESHELYQHTNLIYTGDNRKSWTLSTYKHNLHRWQSKVMNSYQHTNLIYTGDNRKSWTLSTYKT